MSTISVVIPCYNEMHAVQDTLRDVVAACEERGVELQNIITVNDGSSDQTGELLDEMKGQLPEDLLIVVHHPRNMGYGASLKSGIRRAESDLICITDADGTYPNHRIPDLFEIAQSADMVVGARTGDDVTYSKLRAIPKIFLMRWVSWIVGQRVPDMNSGLRVFRRDLVLKYIGVLPDTFSFTTTITICMIRGRHNVVFEPIDYHERIGKSHIKPVRDTLRFSQLIGRTGMYFAPLRLLAPVILLLGLLFLASLLYDVFYIQDLTDKTVLLVLFTMNTAMFALLADMIDKRSGG